MARNRKNHSAAIRFGPAIKAVLLCALIGGSGVGYVWQKDQIKRLSNQRKQLEMRLDALRRKNENGRKQLATMRNPEVVRKRIKELNLNLVEAQPSQVWRLREPVAGLAETNAQYAAREQEAANVQ